MRYGPILLAFAVVCAAGGAGAASVTPRDPAASEPSLKPDTDIFAPIEDTFGTDREGIFTAPMEGPELGNPPLLADPMRSIRPKSQWARPTDGDGRRGKIY